MTNDKSVVGELINFRGLVYAPMNENGVIFLFGKVLDDLHMYIEEIKPGFPDCVARRFTGRGWERVTIEFEYESLAFKLHGHDSKNCDIVVCWEHNWSECPIEIIELKNEIVGMKNWPVKPPSSNVDRNLSGEDALMQIFTNQKSTKEVREWYQQIEQALKQWNEEIWMNIAKKYIGVYSPERAFASIKIMKQAIQIELFSRGLPLAGTKVRSQRFSPRWVVMTIKNASDVKKAIEILMESHRRLKEAAKAGENTAYFSGGEKIPAHKE